MVCLIIAFPSSASALTTSFDNINFKPAIDEGKYFTVYGSGGLPSRSFVAGTYLDFAYKPIEFNLSGGRKQDLVKDLLVWDFYGAIGITNWWEFGMNVPIVLYDRYTDPLSRQTETLQSLGDILLGMKFRLLDAERFRDIYRVGVAFLPFVSVPTRLGNSYVSNQSFSGGGTAVIDYMPVDFFSIAVNAGYLVRKHFTDQYGADIGNQFLYGVGFAAGPFKRFSAVIELAGATQATSHFGDELVSPLEIRGGVSVDLPYDLTLKAGGGSGIRGGFGDPEYRIFGGVAYNYGAKAEKKVADVRPPETPEAMPVPSVRAEELAAAAEPLPVAAPEIKKPKLAKKPKKAEIVELIKTALSRKIYFKVGSWKIQGEYLNYLDDVAEIMKKFPSVNVSVDGYTCSLGYQARNVILSTLRAIAVENYLVGRGVPQKRITHQGFGSESPVADNFAESGRAKNRRVEFAIIPPFKGS